MDVGREGVVGDDDGKSSMFLVRAEEDDLVDEGNDEGNRSMFLVRTDEVGLVDEGNDGVSLGDGNGSMAG